MEKVVVPAVDCYRHDYWKVPVSLLVELNIIDEITEYSFLGDSDTPLNEDGFAYLEIDCDCGTFEQAMKFYGREFSIDFDTLQEEFDSNYEDANDWLENLVNYDTEYLSVSYDWEPTPSDLKEFLKKSEECCDECGERFENCECED